VAAEANPVAAGLTRDALMARGEAIGRALVAPALITLHGELGAGKTTLVQAICRGLGVAEPVTSPTFALIHEYHATRGRVVHCDLYRLESPSAVVSLGLEEYLGEPDTIVLIEWPERAAGVLPAPTVSITLSHDAAEPEVRRCAETWAA
jgi:tRNA threonylcarbamoyladenosine biosynthesis protein TsaE